MNPIQNLKFQNTFIKIHSLSKHLISAAVLLAVIQLPSVLNTDLQVELIPQTMAETVSNEVAVVSEFFGNDATADEAAAIVEKQVEFVASRKAYPASLAVVEKHAEAIKTVAKANDVPQDVAIGVALLENGGSETAKSPAGALGIYQLMPGTARNLGLTVNKQEDERKNPTKSIEAGVSYLKGNYERFGDWGLATWAYHAGEGNVSKALKIYAKTNHNVTLAGVSDPAGLREYVESHDITIHKLLSDPSVKEFTKKLNDDSAGYPYKVLATATLYKEASSR